jgi:hypothetical protein
LPVFILQPQGATGQEGVPLTLTAAAVGEGTVTYQWYRDGFLIGGATSASHTMASGGTSVGDYTVVASNLAGAVTSGTARVEGRVAPLVISTFLPPAVAVVSGSSTTFAVDWEGPSNTTFQWFRNGVPVSGATSAVLKFAPARGSDAGTYRVTVQAGTTVLSGGTVHFTVNVPVSIFNQPEAEVAILQGKPLALRVSAAGTPPLSYQWVRNGTEILGGTGSSYAIAQMNDVSAGTYTVRVRNAFGQVESEPSRVSVVVPPVVTIQSEARRFVNELGGLTLSVSATGTAPLSYQWRKDGVPIGGGTSTALTLQVGEPSSENRRQAARIHRCDGRDCGSLACCGCRHRSVQLPMVCWGRADRGGDILRLRGENGGGGYGADGGLFRKGDKPIAS